MHPPRFDKTIVAYVVFVILVVEFTCHVEPRPIGKDGASYLHLEGPKLEEGRIEFSDKPGRGSRGKSSSRFFPSLPCHSTVCPYPLLL